MRALVLLAVAALALASQAPPVFAHGGRGEAAASATGLGVCDMSVALARQPAHRLRGFVPARHRLGTSLYSAGLMGFGTVVVWVMECDRIELPSGPPQHAIVSVVGIQIQSPQRPTSIATIANMFDVYAVAIDTDNARVARWLRRGGMPARTVVGTRMDRTRDVRIEVPAGRSAYSLRLTPLHPDPVGTHTHANAFWHDRGARTARLGLDIPVAEDVACVQLAALCGEIEAQPRSPLARILGRTRRPVDFVFDHVGLEDGHVSLSSAQP